MAGSYSRARYRPHPARPNDDPAPNILGREFDGYAPRTHIAADPAYVGGGSSWACICLPATSRTARSSATPSGRGTTRISCWPRSPRFPLGDIEVFHTDRGGEFTGERIERMLDVFGITRSLSNPGSPYDNAVVESTNRLVKKELVCDNVYTSVERLRSDLNRYVWWYNYRRLYSTLDYMSPVEYAKQGNTL